MTIIVKQLSRQRLILLTLIFMLLFAGSTYAKNQPSAKDYFAQAESALDKGNYTDALNDLNRAIELDPKMSSAYINRGILYKNQGDYDAALDDYNKAAELNPSDAVIYINRANLYSDCFGNSDAAINDYTHAIKLDPKITYGLY